MEESENLKAFRLNIKRRLLSENKMVKDQPKRDKSELQKFLDELYKEELKRYSSIWNSVTRILKLKDEIASVSREMQLEIL